MCRTATAVALRSVISLAPAPLPSGAEHVNGIGMKLLRVEAGGFVVGSGDAPPRTREEWDAREWDEAPAHEV